MAKKILACKECWIPVTLIPKAEKIFGKNEGEVQYKHKSLKDDVGQPYCGKTLLGQRDVEFIEQFEEFYHPSDEY